MHASPAGAWAVLGCLIVAVPLQPASAQTGPAGVRVEECLTATLNALGGDALHVEYESRAGVPTYEFIVGTPDDVYYVGCSAVTGVISEVDVIVAANDPRWTAVAKIDEAAATKTALDRYKGELEEVKRLLLASGAAAYEVDVEVPGADGEFNVYVDAASGNISQVTFEYREIGRPGVRRDDE
jgi:uncharacterized membrane protein YkoI